MTKIQFERCGINDCTSYPEFNLILLSILPKGISKRDALFYLEQNAQMMKVIVGDQVVGIYSVEDDGKWMECHPYMFPQHRRYSIASIRAILQYCKDAGRVLKTVVSSDIPHIIQFLHKLGMTVDDVGSVERTGGSYTTYTLTYK